MITRLLSVAGIVLAVVALVALWGAVDGARGQPQPASVPAVSSDARALAGVAEALELKADQRDAALRARQRDRRERARQAEARRLRASRTVRGAIRRAWLSYAITRKRYDEMRSIWYRAQRDVGRLSGLRRSELRAAVRMAEGLAARRILTSSRLAAVLLTVRRNREYWTKRPIPRAGERITFRGDPVIFEYYSGRGLAIQPLATFGKANALAASCVRTAARHRCRPAALGRLLDRMLALGSQRGGFLAWEYFIAFGGGSPPWISGMTQATGAQAFARGHRALRDERYARAARRSLGAFERSPPLGVAVRSGTGWRYTMYSFSPGLQIFNGELQALIGLRDVSRIISSARAGRLFARAEPLARRSVPAIDTGAWSLYSHGGRESNLNYHRLVGTFLDRLCSRTGTSIYCNTGRRFSAYVLEPPRIDVRAPRKLRARRLTSITFKLSKISKVIVEMRDRRGRVELARGMRLPRGLHRIPWKPKLVGRHRLRIVAIGPAGTRREIKRTWTAKLVKRKKKAAGAAGAGAKAKAKAGAKAKAKAGAKAKAKAGAKAKAKAGAKAKAKAGAKATAKAGAKATSPPTQTRAAVAG